MIEIHPFSFFVPTNAKFLILGSFTGKNVGENSYDWFYGTKRNQFWPILEAVYKVKLNTKEDKKDLFEKLHMAIGDIIYSCERKKSSNLDVNLVNIIYNTKVVEEVLEENNLTRIFFTSRFVEKKFKQVFKDIIKHFSNIELITLPSPSPRYAVISKEEKIKRYKKLLPKM